MVLSFCILPPPPQVGILFFLFEFFNDQLLAFLVLSLVWVAELFSVVCARTITTLKYFPKVFARAVV
jgi:hypothetical protein